MAEFEFAIDPEVARRFPGIVVQALCCAGFHAAAARIDDATLLSAAIEGVRDLGLDREKLAAHPAMAVWREGYAALRVRPSQFRASIEALVRRVLGGGDLALPIPSVNLYNALSLKHLAPMGAYDLAKLPAAPMALRLAVPDTDRFDPLGGRAADFPLGPDLVVYASADIVLCWGFNCRDSRATGLDPASDRIVFFSESLDAEGAARSRTALAELHAILTEAGASCGPLLTADAGAPRF